MGRAAGIKLSGKEINELENARKHIKDARSFRAMSGVLYRSQGK